jgi:hypothetical protein
MSNKDRIARMAAEKEAAKKEKATKKKTAAKKKTTKKKASKSSATKSAGRMKVVWVVCDQAGGPVKTFAFNEEKTARTEADRLTQDKGKTHFVKRDKVPMES